MRPPRLRPPPARTARVDRSTSATRPMRQRGKAKTGTGPCGPGVPDAGRTVLRGTALAAQGGLPVAPWTRTSTPGFLPGSGGRAGCPCAGELGDVDLGVWSGRIGLWPGRAARGTPASASRVRCACTPRFRPGTAATSRVPPRRGGRRSPRAPAGTPPPLAAPTGWASTPRTASRIWLWSWTACSVSSWAWSTPCSSSGVEDRFLGAGAHLEAVGEFLPPLGQLGGVLERLDLGEGAPNDLVLAEHEHGQRRGRWSWRCGGFYRLRGMTKTTMRVMMLKIKPRIPNRTAL